MLEFGSFARLYQSKINGCLFLSFKDAFHFIWIQLDFEINCLEEIHMTEAIAFARNQFALVALTMVLLLLQNCQFVIETFPFDLIYPLNFKESVLDIFDNLVELFHIYLEDCTGLTDTLSFIRVGADTGDVFES